MSFFYWVNRVHDFLSGTKVFPLLASLEKSERLPLGQIRETQWIKLKALIRHSYENIPYYRDLFSSHGLMPDSIRNFEDYRRIPFLEKKIIRQNKERLLLKGNKRKGRWRRTSGSTGKSLDFFADEETLRYHRALMMRSYGWWGIRPGDRRAGIWRNWNHPLSIKTFTDVVKRAFLERSIVLPTHLLHDEGMEAFHEKLKSFKPKLLFGYPSVLAMFSKFILKRGLEKVDLGLKLIAANSEIFYPDQRKIVSGVFKGVPVCDIYGTTETGLIAFECPSGAMHLIPETTYVEFEPIPGSENQTIIVTPLSNYRMPFLRYDLGDLVQSRAGTCACGRAFPLIDIKIGRRRAFVVDSEGHKIDPAIIQSVFEHMFPLGQNPVHQLQLHQTFPGRLKIQVVLDANKNTEGQLLTKIQQLLSQKLPLISFELIRVREIPRDPSGKQRVLITTLQEA